MKFMYVVFVVLMCLQGSQGQTIIQKELLAMKAILNSLQGLPSQWKDSPTLTAAQYCTWEGIVCFTPNGPVGVIQLASPSIQGPFPKAVTDFQYLFYLILFNTKISGTIPTEIGKWEIITRIVLSDNALQSTLPTQIGLLTSLVDLQLGSAQLKGTIPTELGNTPQLVVLNLGRNSLTGTIPTQLGRLTKLTELNLFNVPLSGTIPTEFGRLTNLVELIIRATLVSGPIPTQIGLCTHLKALDLAFNKLNGPIPTQIGYLSSLTRFYLFSNRVSGTIPREIKNLRQISEFLMSSNRLTGPIPTEMGGLTRLTSLDLHSNDLSGMIPTQIGNLRQITLFSLQNNPVGGTLPTELFDPSSALAALQLHSTKLSGILPTQMGRLNKLNVFTAYSAQLSGTIPTQIGKLVNLYRFDVANNRLEGTLPTQLCNLGELRSFSISNNQLGGAFPNCQFPVLNTYAAEVNFFTGTLPSLVETVTLAMFRENKLTGTIPTILGTFKQLRLLSLGQNSFTGTIPTELGQLTQLSLLDIGANSLSGTLPTQLSQLRLLASFSAWRNRLEGPVPDGYASWKSIRTIRISFNRLSGSVGLFSSGSVIPNATTLEISNNLFPSIIPPSYDTSRYQLVDWFPQNFNCSLVDTIPYMTCPNRVCRAGACECFDGFVLYGNECIDINECENGAWLTSPSLNTKKPCPRQESCINRRGGFECCPQGSRRNLANSSVCVDIDECHISTELCDRESYCLNTDPGYECRNCSSASFITTKDPSESAMYPSLSKYLAKNFSFDFQFCRGHCTSGGMFSIPVDSAAEKCSQIKQCQFACTNLSGYDTSRSALSVLEAEWNRGSFLANVFSVIFKVSVTRSPKRGNDLMFDISPCLPSTSIVEAQDLLTGLTHDIVPRIPQLSIQMASGCSMSVSSSDPAQMAGIAVPIALVVTIVLLLIVFFYFYYFKNELRRLPEEIAWSYRQYKLNPFGWSFRGTKQTGYHSKQLAEGSQFYQRAHDLLKGLHHESTEFSVKEIYAIYNPVLIKNFVGSYLISINRSEKREFTTHRFPTYHETSGKQRDFVTAEYEKLVARYKWNQDTACPIIPVLHGTDLIIAEKICESGFAALSSLDAGFYGKGIYFTSHLIYTIPYIISKRQPALIISWVIPGSIYPVIEDHQGPNSLLGAPMKSGHGSHYVLTTSQGKCIPDQLTTPFYDELVISQENQITPAYIVHLDSDSLPSLVQSWQKI